MLVGFTLSDPFIFSCEVTSSSASAADRATLFSDVVRFASLDGDECNSSGNST